MTALFNSDYQHNKHLIDSCFYEFVYQVNDKNRLINQLRTYKNYCCDCLSKVFNKFNSLCKLINDDKNQMIKESNNQSINQLNNKKIYCWKCNKNNYSTNINFLIYFIHYYDYQRNKIKTTYEEIEYFDIDYNNLKVFISLYKDLMNYDKTKEYIDGIVILLNKEVHNAFYDYSCYPERYIKILINCCKSYLNELVIMHYIYDSGYINLFENDKYYQSFLSTLSRNTLSTFIKDEKVIDEILNISDNEMIKISEKYLSKLINS